MRIATYNVQNMFASISQMPKPESQMRPLARMVDQVGADVMVLQEVGCQAALDELNARLRSPYPFAKAVLGNSNRSIHLAVLARSPVVVDSHRDEPLLDDKGETVMFYASAEDAASASPRALVFFRDVVRVALSLPGGARLALYGVHLKSRTNTEWQLHSAESLRSAECRGLVALVQRYQRKDPQEVSVLLGDFNDLLSSPALADLNSLGITDALGEVLRSQGRNPATYWPKRRMRLDHILLCDQGATQVSVTQPQIHISHMARTASDHYPVSLDLIANGS